MCGASPEVAWRREGPSLEGKAPTEQEGAGGRMRGQGRGEWPSGRRCKGDGEAGLSLLCLS